MPERLRAKPISILNVTEMEWCTDFDNDLYDMAGISENILLKRGTHYRCIWTHPLQNLIIFTLTTFLCRQFQSFRHHLRRWIHHHCNHRANYCLERESTLGQILYKRGQTLWWVKHAWPFNLLREAKFSYLHTRTFCTDGLYEKNIDTLSITGNELNYKFPIDDIIYTIDESTLQPTTQPPLITSFTTRNG